MPLSIPLSDDVRFLAAAGRAAFGPDATPIMIDERIAQVAVHRHRIGPVLFQGVQHGRMQGSGNSKAILVQHWLANAHACANTELFTQRLKARLSEEATSCVLFKGNGLAKLLYPEATWRHCGDIDIQVPPGQMRRALAALGKVGAVGTDPVLALPAAALALTLKIIRDVALFDPASGRKIELHSRLLFSRSISENILAAEESLRPRLADLNSPLPEPVLGSGLALYLLLHGAVSGWSRLKWLLDIPLLIARLNSEQRQKLAEMAESANTAAAVKAGLLLAKAAFGEIDYGPLDGWINERAGRRSVVKRANVYATWLCATANTAPNPLQDRNAALRSCLLLSGAPTTKAAMVVFGSISAALRITAKGLHGLRNSGRKSIAAN